MVITHADFLIQGIDIDGKFIGPTIHHFTVAVNQICELEDVENTRDQFIADQEAHGKWLSFAVITTIKYDDNEMETVL